MYAKYILAALSVVFFVLAIARLSSGGVMHPKTRTRLVVAVIFAIVSAWLFYAT